MLFFAVCNLAEILPILGRKKKNQTKVVHIYQQTRKKIAVFKPLISQVYLGIKKSR